MSPNVGEFLDRFDAEFYCRTYGSSIPPGIEPFDHFLRVGLGKGFLASRHFDPVVHKLLRSEHLKKNMRASFEVDGGSPDYRNIAAIFPDIHPEEIQLRIKFPRELRAEWTANGEVIARNVDRSVRLPWGSGEYELHNPHPTGVLSRIRSGSPFCFTRLPQGFWDEFYVVDKLAEKLRSDNRCRELTEAEVVAVATRLVSRSRLRSTSVLAENFLSEVEADLRTNPRDEDFWTAISLKGPPTPRDDMSDFDEHDVAERLRLVSRYFSPADRLYDATIWKRWAMSGHLAMLPEAVRNHMVVVVAPEQFQKIRKQWSLENFCHVSIPPLFSHFIRQKILEAVSAALGSVTFQAKNGRRIVLFQCSAELAYWLIRRLRPLHPEDTFIDLGQGLDLWYWVEYSPWANIYGETIRAANPFVVPVLDENEYFDPAASEVFVADLEHVSFMLGRDYLQSGLMSLARPVRLIGAIQARYEHKGGHGWVAHLPDDFASTMSSARITRHTQLLLLEDGRLLGPGNDHHPSICDEGLGRYSFSGNRLLFSTSDNTVPHENKRSYTIGFEEL
jgi:hypothetical protein